jgi:type II secretory pathway pseudopilin PulG
MIMTIARPRLAFTLIELLVSIALGTFLTGTAVTMFFTTQHLAKRTQARLQLHASAKSIYESMRRDLQSLQQDCAFWLLSRKSDGESAGIDLVFMTGVFDDQGFLMGGRAVSSGYDNIEWKTTDLVWCRWSWSGDATDPTRAFRLWTARNDMKRTCTNTSAPTLAGVPYTVLNSVAYNPQPRRATSAWSTYPADDWRGLDDNAWSFPGNPSQNVGDWTDLRQRLMPLPSKVTACTIEIVLAGDGSGAAPVTVRADGSTPIAFCARGVRLDGITEKALGLPAPRDEIADRPSILRIAFTLVDSATGISQDFTFSFALPGVGKLQ